MRRLARVLLAVTFVFALPWSARSGTEAEENGVPAPAKSSRVSLSDLPVRDLRRGDNDLTLPDDPQPAEAPPSPVRAYGYGNFAAGRCNHGFTIVGGGGGGEAFPWRRLGLGGDLGYYQFLDDIGFGLFTFNAALHFGERNTGARVDPYVSASPGFYTTGDDGSGGSFGLGGGFNYWFSERLGLHTDLRFAALGTEEGIFLFRIGVAFR